MKHDPSPSPRCCRACSSSLVKRLLLLLGAVTVLGLLAKGIARTLPNVDWESKFAAMPEDAPPKWMFRNISTIRENTDRIIELLEGHDADGSEPPVGQ